MFAVAIIEQLGPSKKETSFLYGETSHAFVAALRSAHLTESTGSLNYAMESFGDTPEVLRGIVDRIHHDTSQHQQAITQIANALFETDPTLLGNPEINGLFTFQQTGVDSDGKLIAVIFVGGPTAAVVTYVDLYEAV